MTFCLLVATSLNLSMLNATINLWNVVIVASFALGPLVLDVIGQRDQQHEKQRDKERLQSLV